ncbi:WG repeat-containing protein [Sphingobacterium sp. E70]|uniref:WG repeat-containing protein n=1 Tax=Sphingobacterium sp. E70 TaxID=2853439 RepID=UPI00211C1AF4|nr:WG repeat-containing protein [Sphingobacterium sp. E70]ULT26999.1 WG repeat-containing protein [Sphingobacterium sp. E70]
MLDYQNKRVDLPANLRYIDISRSAEGMIPFSDYDGYGFIDLNGKIVIQPQYSNITEFYRGHALVRTAKEELFLIDKNNRIFKKIVLPPSPDGSQRLMLPFQRMAQDISPWERLFLTRTEMLFMFLLMTSTNKTGRNLKNQNG